MKIYNSLSTVLWVSLVSISMILQVPKDVSAAWGWDSSSSSETKEVDEVQINEEALTAEIPVSFENHSSMELYIHWVNRDTHEETSVLDTPLLPSGVLNIQSYPGHTFVAFNEERTVRLVYLVDIDEKNARKFIITEKDLSPDREVTATFINTSSQSVHINSVNQETKEEQSVAHNVASFVGEIDDDTDAIKPQQGVVSIQSYPGHVFAIFDEERSFRTLLTVDPSHTHGDQAVFTITDFDTDPLACEAHFINSLTTPESVVRVTWVNPDTGKETTVIDQLLANQARSIQTRKGHTFFAYDVQHTFFRTEFVIHAGQGQEQFLHITGVNGSATANKTLAKFINMSPTSMVHINYLNKETQEEQLVIENLRPREDHVLETHSGHQFVAYDEAQTFRKVYTMTVDKGMTERHLIDGTARTCSDGPVIDATLEPSSNPSKAPNDYDTASIGWRIYTTPQDLPGLEWDVQELEFYENLDCTTKISTNTGQPIDSGNAGNNWTANSAFDGGAWAWGGRQDRHGVFWIGMFFQEVVTVKCIRIQNHDGNAANEIQIQAYNTNQIEGDTVWIVHGLDTSGSAWNTISLDFPYE